MHDNLFIYGADPQIQNRLRSPIKLERDNTATTRNASPGGEDECEIQGLLRESLVEAGYQVNAVEDGQTDAFCGPKAL
jgi:hypothetical protein